MLRPALATCCVALLAVSCMSEETCPDRAPDSRPASTPTAWVEASAPQDVSLLQAAARVVLAGDRQAVIRPLFRARITRFHVQAGDRVRAGQPIVDVVMPEVVIAAAGYRGALLRGAAHNARRDKLTGLRNEGLVAERDVFDVATRAAEVEQQALTAAATLRAAGLDPSQARELLQKPEVTLTSAVDGVVRELNGRLGEVIEGQGPPIASVVGEGVPRVEARFLQAPPARATLRFHAVDGSVWPLRPEPLARTVEADDGAIVMWFQVEGDRLAAPGLRGTVEAFSDEPGVVQVPAGALRRRDDALIVYRRRDGQVAAVAVELLMASGASALVRAVDPTQLSAGERIAEDALAYERAQAGAGA
ncbi:efflux RND transporter periplasmic adaptor subunit [Nannocystis bainbridge]|uniref:Efflux RND transporter periplasmic adaptor subunit n=1 Tax=Nannocystis bainbridge TaxID=2995303 RepID=A0ABT5DS35_9BACT|nr:efflux RND transporter periplasmic adaptor subunit [Nannocystis bainbridge]MDC0716445.1 efflux RND transporter periplasmic adaptor subunit [Nannocystis bainbridge]